MVHFKAASITIFLSLFLSPGAADESDLSADGVGCKAVSCRNFGDGNDHCTVGRNIISGVGLARIPNVASSQESLSLAKGVDIADSDSTPCDKTLPFKSVYYLGTPAHPDAKRLTGCAAFFNDPPARSFNKDPVFYGDNNGTDLCAALDRKLKNNSSTSAMI